MKTPTLLCAARLRAPCVRFAGHTGTHRNNVDGDWIDADPEHAKSMQDVLDTLAEGAGSGGPGDDIALATYTSIRSGLEVNAALCEMIKLFVATRRRQYKMLVRAGELLDMNTWAKIMEAGNENG